MQNTEKAEAITRQLVVLSILNDRYQIQRCGYFFDYDGVCVLLDAAMDRMEKTLQAEHPEWMPPDLSQPEERPNA